MVSWCYCRYFPPYEGTVLTDLIEFLLSLKQPSVTQGSCQVFFAAGKNSKHISTYMYEVFSKL